MLWFIKGKFLTPICSIHPVKKDFQNFAAPDLCPSHTHTHINTHIDTSSPKNIFFAFRGPPTRIDCNIFRHLQHGWMEKNHGLVHFLTKATFDD